MTDIRPIGLFTFSCLIACLTQALPDWLIIFSIIGICLKFWRGLKLPALLLYGMMIAFWSLLIFDNNGLWRNTITGALVLATLFNILSPAHKHRVMRFHVGIFGLILSVLVIPKETYPVWLYFVLSVLCCASLVLHHVEARSLLSIMTLSRSLVKLTIPLTGGILVLYFIFPEIRTPTRMQASSGLSSDLEPGKIASLALSDRLAFRVNFIGELPDRSTMYWRAEVLEKGLGLKWSQGTAYSSRPILGKNPSGPLVYEMMLDSQLNGMIPVLEQTYALSSHQEKAEVRIIDEKGIIKTDSTFLVGAASIGDRWQNLTPPDLRDFPESNSPRVRALVDTLKTKAPAEQITLLLDMFRSYRYTLQPGVLRSDDTLDEFLFETKKGFCEHFAASFASLMRMAGTPTRIVIGYQGGSRLGGSSYYQITNGDAHAWTEVWIDGIWRRVDPSSVALNASDARRERSSLSAQLLAWMSFTFQRVSDWLNEWSEDIGVMWISIGITAIGLILIQIYRIKHRHEREPRWEMRMRKFLSRIEALGLKRASSETVFHFLHRAADETSYEPLRELAAHYNDTKFGEIKGAAEALERSLESCQSMLPKLKKEQKLKKESGSRRVS